MSNKFDKLTEILKSYKKVMVAFSGGIDSSFLLLFSKEVLGKENVIAVTGVSETYTKDEYNFAIKFSEKEGVEQVFVNTTEFDNPDFVKNPKERCYHCKNELYSSVKKIADKKGIKIIIDGTNDSDKGDYRPGKKAAKEHGVLSPLAETEITKDDIRNYLKEKGFDFYDKPANPCLASRIPYGDAITVKKLNQVEEGERFLKGLGFNIVRVRNHDKIARIEVLETDFIKLIELKKNILNFFKKIGFNYVSLDLEGYRIGSMNEVLNK